MKILNLILILSVVFFVGCPSRSTTNSEGEVSDVDTIISDVEKVVEPEDWHSFIDRFERDSVFQRERIILTRKLPTHKTLNT